MKEKVLALALATTIAISLADYRGSSDSTASTIATAVSTETTATAPPNSGVKTIKIIRPCGVEGTTDMVTRKYALVAGKTRPEYNFIVEDMTGNDGFTAANYYTDQGASARKILVYGYSVAHRHDLGRKYNTKVVDFDCADIYPMVATDDRTRIMCTTSAQTLEGILARAEEGGVKMSGGDPLSDPHLALDSLIAQEGGKVMIVSYDRGAAQEKGLTDGEVGTFIETAQAILKGAETGTMISILAFPESTFEGFKGPDGDIPVSGITDHAKAPRFDASKDYTGSILAADGLVAVHTDADQARINEIAQVSESVWTDTEYSDWISEITLDKCETYGENAVKHLEFACEKVVAAFDTLNGQ